MKNVNVFCRPAVLLALFTGWAGPARADHALRLWRLALFLAAVGSLNLSFALGPEAEEIRQAHRWSAEHFDPGSPVLPFSFVFGGRPSSELLNGWTRAIKHRKPTEQLIQHQLTLADPQTGLQVDCVAVEYKDYPVVEWI